MTMLYIHRNFGYNRYIELNDLLLLSSLMYTPLVFYPTIKVLPPPTDLLFYDKLKKKKIFFNMGILKKHLI